MEFPGKSTGVGCLFLLQRIFPTQGSNPGLPHLRRFTIWATREALRKVNKYSQITFVEGKGVINSKTVLSSNYFSVMGTDPPGKPVMKDSLHVPESILLIITTTVIFTLQLPHMGSFQVCYIDCISVYTTSLLFPGQACSWASFESLYSDPKQGTFCYWCPSEDTALSYWNWWLSAGGFDLSHNDQLHFLFWLPRFSYSVRGSVLCCVFFPGRLSAQQRLSQMNPSLVWQCHILCRW